MTDIEHLISLNVELEGLLRVLAERDSIHARSALAEKFRAYSNLLQKFLDGTPVAKDISAVNEAARNLAAEATHTEVKDQEAQETEDETSLDAAEQILDKAESPTPNAKLIKAFTLNDRFRFRRELFDGNDADLSDTITLLADMDSYEEAADYLVNDMMWDKDNPTVRDFLAILAQNMPR